MPDHEGAWWVSPEGIERVRKVVELAEKRVKGRKKSICDVGKQEKAAKDTETATPKTGGRPREGEKGDEHGKASTPKSGKKGRGMPSPMSPLLRRQSQKKLTTPGSAPASKKVGVDATSPCGPVSADILVSTQTMDVGAGTAPEAKRSPIVPTPEHIAGTERVDGAAVPVAAATSPAVASSGGILGTDPGPTADIQGGAAPVLAQFSAPTAKEAAATSPVVASSGDIPGTDPGQATEVQGGAASVLPQLEAEAGKKSDVEVYVQNFIFRVVL